MDRRSYLSIALSTGIHARLRHIYVLLITFHAASEWPLKTWQHDESASM
jgi:hypothetical protein